MSKISAMMDMGRRSMSNSQTALQTVSHNIANKSTEGYSRQRVDLKAMEPTGTGDTRVGTGARTTGVSRINNQFMEKQIEKESNSLGHKDGKSATLSRVEQVFNEQLNKGLSKTMSDFFNSYRELSNNPESSAIRNLVKESAQNLSADFKKVTQSLNKIQDEADYQITVNLSEINALSKEVASLNEKIASVEIGGVTANDERDRREQIVKQMSEKMNIRYGESKDGQYSITAGNNAILVSGSSYREMTSSPTGEREGKREGNSDIFYKMSDTGTAYNITKQITGGTLGGILEVRDGFCNELHKEVDQLAKGFTDEVNKAHAEGFDRYGKPAVAFFNPIIGEKGAADSVAVNERILSDVGLISSGGAPDAPGDNRVANVISSLQYQKVMGDGVSTFDDFYNNIVGRVGVSAARANSELETQKDTVKQLKNLRESVSGVSLDEETAKMIEFQKMFEASARMIRTSDEMLQTVLNLKQM